MISSHASPLCGKEASNVPADNARVDYVDHAEDDKLSLFRSVLVNVLGAGHNKGELQGEKGSGRYFVSAGHDGVGLFNTNGEPVERAEGVNDVEQVAQVNKL